MDAYEFRKIMDKFLDEMKIRPLKNENELFCVLYMHFKHFECIDNSYDVYPLLHGGIFRHYLMGNTLDTSLIMPKNLKIWVAVEEDDDGVREIHGSVAVGRTESGNAQLRLLYADSTIRGKGIGKKLMDTALQYCKEQGFARVFLRTLDIFDLARNLFYKYGFRPTETLLSVQCGSITVTEERWDLLL